MVDSIVNLAIDDSSGKWESWKEELNHAVLLESDEARAEVQMVLGEIAKEYDWKQEEGGLSREEKRLIDAYDYALTIPAEQRRRRHQKTLTHMTRKEGKVPELDNAGKEFLRTLGVSLTIRPEENEVATQEILDVARRMGVPVDKNPTPEQKAMTEEGKRRRQERGQIRKNWRESWAERGIKKDDPDRSNHR